LVRISAVVLVVFYPTIAPLDYGKHGDIRKTGSNNIATSAEEDGVTAISNIHRNLVKFGRVVFRLCERAERQTDIHVLITIIRNQSQRTWFR